MGSEMCIRDSPDAAAGTWVVLDDLPLHEVQTKCAARLKDRFVHVDAQTGLTSTHSRTAIDLLGTPLEPPAPLATLPARGECTPQTAATRERELLRFAMGGTG